MKTVDVSLEDVEPPDWLPDVSSVAAFTLEAVSISNYEVGVLLCTDSRIADLNSTYRGIDGPTDVLAFSQDEGDQVPVESSDGLRGDVAISLESVQANAERFGVGAAEEIVRVAVHGLLHLAGYGHEGVTLSDSTAGKHPMLALQEQIVEALTKEQKE
ncbi:MAG: rRNA maturation RNase YbeY [Spirochaetales bacterium]|nr:rRNA maturation RNase YbeY [Spirochaetales bacterium]